MTEPRRYADTMRFHAMEALFRYVLPILLNIAVVIYMGGRYSSKVDDMQRDVARIEGKLDAHLAALALLQRLPQGDQSIQPTVPAPPQKQPTPQQHPQRPRKDAALRRAKTAGVN
jgi:hypothetical protein